MAGSVKLLRNQAPAPGQNGIRLGPLRDVFQRFASNPFGNLGQRDSLRIGKPQPHWQMASQNPILCDQVLVAEQQILIHQPRFERQEASPVESIAHGGTSIITTVGQRSSFARVFWLNGHVTESRQGRLLH
jgi:hypothetical protein